MKRYYTFLFLIVSIITIDNSYGQNVALIKKLHEKLNQEKKIDTSTVHILNDLSWEYNKTNFQRAIKYASRAIIISDSLDFYNGKTTGLNRLGTAYIHQKEFKKAEKIYLEVLDRELKTNYKYGIGRAQNQLGEIYKNTENLDLALAYTKKALQNFKALKKENIVALVSSNLGIIYSELGRYKLSIESYHTSLDIRRRLQNQKGVAHTLLGLSTLYIKLEDYSKAIASLKESQEIFSAYKDPYELAKVYNNLGVCFYELKEFDKALFYYQKAQNIKKRLGLETKSASTLNNLGALYHEKGNLQLAISYYQKSNAIQTNTKTLLSTTINIADIYYLQSDYLQAIEMYTKALELSEKSGYIVSQLKILNDLSLCYSSLKQYDKALTYNNRYIMLQKELNSNYKQAIQRTAKYEKLVAENQRKKIIIIGLILGLILLLLLFYFIFRNKYQRQKIKVRDKEIKIKQQEIDGFLKTQEINAISSMIDIQEKERKRISEDLHDRIGSLLSTVKMYFKSVEQSVENLQKENLVQYQKANQLLDDACNEVRRISHDLGAGQLMKFGLITALETLKNNLEASKQITVVFITHGIDNRFDNDIEIGVYRMVQELISNVLNHANAKEITIQLIKNNDVLNIMVEDDGIGFDVSKKEDTGIGIINVKSRVDALNGVFFIDSTIDKGTTVSINIPILKT